MLVLPSIEGEVLLRDKDTKIVDVYGARWAPPLEDYPLPMLRVPGCPLWLGELKVELTFVEKLSCVLHCASPPPPLQMRKLRLQGMEFVQECTAPMVEWEYVLTLIYRAHPHPTEHPNPLGNRQPCHSHAAGAGPEARTSHPSGLEQSGWPGEGPAHMSPQRGGC